MQHCSQSHARPSPANHGSCRYTNTAGKSKINEYMTSKVVVSTSRHLIRHPFLIFLTAMSGAGQYLCQPRFHKTYTLPPNPDTGRLRPYRFSYSDFGDRSSNAVVLFCGGLMATRLCYTPLDQLANAHNVRILHVDRPGIGKSSTVKLERRVQLWLGLSGSGHNLQCTVTYSCRNGTTVPEAPQRTLRLSC